MTRSIVSAAIAVSIGLVAPSRGLAQTTRTEEVEQQKAVKAADIEPEHRQEGDIIVTRLQHIFSPEPPALKLSFGGFRPGAGIAPGIAYVTTAGERALWTTKTAWSIRNFKLAESAIEWKSLARTRLNVRALGRWEDAPQLVFFGVGAGTTKSNAVSYGLQSSQIGVAGDLGATRWLKVGGGVEYLRVESGDGSGPRPPIGSVLTTSSAPGLDSRPTWLHSRAYLAVDWRESPGYTHRGGFYQIAFHDYSDRQSRYSFTRTEMDLRQFVPVIHDNWIIAVQARADLTDTTGDHVIPYFMQPYIGGGDTLRGFATYRFTDRNSFQLRSELRWTPSSVIDMAVFRDEGTVAPRWRNLDLRELKSGWGVGARLHGDTSTALRLEVARSGEGWRCHVAQNMSF